MKNSFEHVLPRVLAHEGGFVNDPDDPGGPTNRGVTQRVYDGYRKRKGLSPRSVRGITAEEIHEIYRHQYWDAVRGDDLPLGLDYAVFDYAVNSGVKRAAQHLQEVLGVRMDGIIGEMTISEANDRETIGLIEAYVNRRMKFLRQIRKGGGWKKFGRGWTRRVMGEQEGFQEGDTGVVDVAILMIHKQPVPQPSAPARGKAMEPERESVAESKIAQVSVADIAAKIGVGAGILPQLDGKVQIIFGVAVILMIILSFIAFRSRLQAWADGWK